MHENISHEKRYNKTLSFLKKHIQGGSRILDLGIHNPLSKLMQQQVLADQIRRYNSTILVHLEEVLH